jgi:hypothetical protein
MAREQIGPTMTKIRRAAATPETRVGVRAAATTERKILDGTERTDRWTTCPPRGHDLNWLHGWEKKTRRKLTGQPDAVWLSATQYGCPTRAWTVWYPERVRLARVLLLNTQGTI